MIHILVTGANGQLGSEIASLKSQFLNYKLFLTDKEELDITNFDNLKSFVQNNEIKVIINCAAYTNVDKAEEDEESALAINMIAVKNIAQISKTLHLKVIHISTDYVFDGDSKIPYVESDVTNPQNVYGKTKLNGEEALVAINPKNTIIIRTSWLYSSFGNNFVKTILKLSKEKETISVISDQIGSPTNARDLANVILKTIPLIQNQNVEIYHYSNEGSCSWFQFSEEIVKISKSKCKIIPILSKDYKTKTKRPKYSLLNKTKIQQAFKVVIPNWEKSLVTCVNQIVGS